MRPQYQRRAGGLVAALLLVLAGVLAIFGTSVARVAAPSAHFVIAAEAEGGGAETFFRTMSKEHAAELHSTGRLPATSETFISPSAEFSSAYEGQMVEFSVRPGTTRSLAGVGVRDSSAVTGAVFPDMPLVSSGWTSTSAFFRARAGSSTLAWDEGLRSTCSTTRFSVPGGSVTPEQRSQVMALVVVPGRESLSDDEFLAGFDTTYGEALGLDLLRDAAAHRDPVDVELALVVCFRFGFSADHVPLLISLAFADWHQRHEDVAMALGRIRAPESVDALAHLAEWVPSYLEYDPARALATKAIWALGSINDDASHKVLESLALSDDAVVAGNAKAQLEK